MTPLDHIDAMLGQMIVPDDLAGLPPAKLRRLRDRAFVLYKATEAVLAARVTEPKSGVLAQLNREDGR